MGTSGKYLTYLVITNIGATVIHEAVDIAAVLKEYNSVNTIMTVLVKKYGWWQLWKKKWNVHIIGCSHQNELPFRAIFKTIDGTTRSPTTSLMLWGNFVELVTFDLPQVKFELISDYWIIFISLKRQWMN